ncbi:MAG: putative quinol monooxygenase [Bacteroidota bacterium]
MITRVVRMHFRPEAEQAFIRIFRSAEPHIRSFKGCRSLGIFKEKGNQCVYFTISEWDSASDLEDYRQSPLFSTTWTSTKALFGGPPSAWTLEKQ